MCILSGDEHEKTGRKADINIVRQVYETNVLGVISVTIAMIPLLKLANQGTKSAVTADIRSVKNLLKLMSRILCAKISIN